MRVRSRWGALGLAAGLAAGVVVLDGAAAVPRSDYALDCAAPTRVISASSSVALTLTSTDVVLIAAGTFTGGLNAFPAGARLCVAPGAVLNPPYMNNAAGSLLSRGSVTLPSVAVNTGFTLDSAGVVSLPSGLNTNGAAALINRAGGTWTVGTSVALSGGAVFSNEGTASFSGGLTLNSGTTLTNIGDLTVGGGFIVNGTATNTGHLIVSASETVNGGGQVTNQCVMTAATGLSNNGTFANAGILGITTGQLSNNGLFGQTPDAWATGVAFSNDGTTRGFGKYRFTGSTRTQGTFAGDSAANPIVFEDTTPTAGQIFDVQSGTVVNVVAGVVAPPRSGSLPAGCASAPSTHADVEVTKTGPATVDAAAPVTYLITVTNHGPASAADVVVNDQVPAALVNPVAVSGTITAGVASWTVGTLASGRRRQSR